MIYNLDYCIQVTVALASKMLEYWYTQHVIQKLSISEEEFWESKGLAVNDWSALAVVFFTDIFSLDFLTPLDDTDTKFKLEVLYNKNKVYCYYLLLKYVQLLI